jgi:hypothetical protein
MGKQKIVTFMAGNITKMKHIDSFDYILGFSLIGTAISLIPEMSETLRFILLLATCVGAVIKLWEQVKKSEHFKEDIKCLWRKIKNRK